jgi:hypothetical protein
MEIVGRCMEKAFRWGLNDGVLVAAGAQIESRGPARGLLRRPARMRRATDLRKVYAYIQSRGPRSQEKILGE